MIHPFMICINFLIANPKIIVENKRTMVICITKATLFDKSTSLLSKVKGINKSSSITGSTNLYHHFVICPINTFTAATTTIVIIKVKEDSIIKSFWLSNFSFCKSTFEFNV